MSEFMTSEWAAAATPDDPTPHVSVQLRAASLQGREQVASVGRAGQSHGPVRPQGNPNHRPQPPPVSQRQHRPAGRLPPPANRKSSAELCADSTFAEDDQNRAIARFRSVYRVAAISATPRTRSPDHYGLGGHVAENARQAYSPEGQVGSRQPLPR